MPQASGLPMRRPVLNSAQAQSGVGESQVEATEWCALVVEDEPLTRTTIRATLLKEGFKVLEAESGEEALGLFDSATPHVVILDIGLPGLNGFEVCQKIRAKREDTGILMLTARTDPEDKITGLTLGADDYLVKPFNPGELIARIRAVLRRSALMNHAEEPLVFGNLCLDFQAQQALKNGVDVNLSPREFMLLAILPRHPGQVMTRDQLGKEVWGANHRGNARALDVFVCKLREKIEDDPTTPQIIRTVRGAGYICG
ncbi:response regulator transcription factor [Geothrix sp. PMB-07]|uniref:response regulator transcription factor n=1 Tax=Geothrix sp. PMB-07 TaxID=3068640 RepID=UPI002741F898|nr:response regulator transcription factor [Geothrix sp. PMB-07]WLT30185.1 response regulator transcription factor [Geothrix sp. PMB-07]